MSNDDALAVLRRWGDTLERAVFDEPGREEEWTCFPSGLVSVFRNLVVPQTATGLPRLSFARRAFDSPVEPT